MWRHQDKLMCIFVIVSLKQVSLYPDVFVLLVLLAGVALACEGWKHHISTGVVLWPWWTRVWILCSYGLQSETVDWIRNTQPCHLWCQHSTLEEGVCDHGLHFETLKGCCGCRMSPSSLKSHGCLLIPLSYLLSCFFCLVLLLFLSCHFSANGSFSWLFSKKLKYFLLKVLLFCMALVEQLGDDSWSVVCAACCHMALVFAIMHLYNSFF